MATTKMTKEDLIEIMKGMSLLEMNELVKALEEEFEVSATPMMMSSGAAVADEQEEKTDFDVVLKSSGEKKIQVIKIVRELTGLGLKEAKDLVDAGGKVLEAVGTEKANDAKNKLEEAGAVIELT